MFEKVIGLADSCIELADYLNELADYLNELANYLNELEKYFNALRSQTTAFFRNHTENRLFIKCSAFWPKSLIDSRILAEHFCKRYVVRESTDHWNLS